MKKDIEILMHIMADVDDIVNFTSAIDLEEFVSNTLVRKAVCMSLINIGDLAKSLYCI